MRFTFTLALLLFATSSARAAESVQSVSVTSSTAGTQIVSSIGGGVCVTVPTGAAVPVYVARIAGTCASVLTSPAGVRIPVPSATSIWSTHCFIPKRDGYSKQLCGILESGGAAVTVTVNAW